jgi:glycosidase
MCAMHARKTARDAYFPTRFDDVFFTARGDIAFKDTGDARRFADKVNVRDERSGASSLRPAEVAAMSLVHEIFHAVIGQYRKKNATGFDKLRAQVAERIGPDGVDETLRTFLNAFPTPAIYRQMQGEGGESEAAETPEKLLAREGKVAEDDFTEEVILLWLTNQNPAYEPVRTIVTDADLGETYQAFVSETQRFFEDDVPFGPRGETLLDLLLAPSRAKPGSIVEQLEYIQGTWAGALGLEELGIWRRLLWAKDFIHEEGKYFHNKNAGPGPGAPLMDAMRFEARTPEEEPKRFSADLDWMPRVVLIAKTAFVWLDQLSKKYRRNIERLDQIPDEELDLLASRGFTGLWLIGLFERSKASKKVKQMRGDQDAVASAYSLMKYDIAWELGGHAAYENLKQRAWQRGLRLAADMVPNHVGIDAEWVMNHPDWFIQTAQPPFPGYKFGGPDLSEDPGVGVFIEEGYWNKTDAAVVFRRHDRETGQDRFIYHGNDGTSMPWNDTAQLDYTKAEVRHAVIETILHVARMFPIIRFDAAMTLAKRHFSRLWFPLPGSGGAIPSRSDYAMTQDEFDRVFPLEFWREVVDTVKARAPDTLLLAEAFWMMEGYFVRSLGMHRVYNSAFMNMLKREENDKYRQTIKNVLDFEPEILKRFVNFMNNPDEETAVAQFGNDDKYFGVCTLMCTMPGLPMFGHGQVEGLHEKYGMEYRRAKWDEPGSRALVERHEREIFPIMKKRYLFSGVEQFALYDFMAESGGVDEDVYAYSNGMGSERALVLYNNKFKDTRGRIFRANPTRREDGSTTAPNVAEALGIDVGQGDWMVFRDASKGLEYLRPMREIDGGFFWELGAFKYHVLHEFRGVNATATKPYAELAAALAGRGVPSIERALVELKYRPVHEPLRQALGAGHLAYLATGWDPKKAAPTKEAIVALEERIRYIADGLAYMRERGIASLAKPGGKAIDPEDVLATLRERYAQILTRMHTPAEDKAGMHLRGKASAGAKASAEADAEARTGTDTAPEPDADWGLLLAWAHLEAVIDLVAEAEPTLARSAIIARWELALPVLAAFSESGDAWAAQRRTALVLLGASLPAGPLREALAGAFCDERARTFLGIHEANGAVWLAKEAFEELARLVAEREVVLGRASVALAEREVEEVSNLAVELGYRADAIAKTLMTGVKLEAPPPSKNDRVTRADKGSAAAVKRPSS